MVSVLWIEMRSLVCPPEIEFVIWKGLIHCFIPDPNIIHHGIPHIMYFGIFKKYKVLVVTKTGPTLYQLLYDAKWKLEIDLVYKIAIYAVSLVLRRLMLVLKLLTLVIKVRA